MIRNVIRAAKILLAALVVPAALFIAPLPASATSASYMCETYGAYCVGAPQIAAGATVDETATGRLLQLKPLTGTFENHQIFEFAFNADPGKCVAFDSSADLVEVHDCGGNGTVWALVTSNGSDMWINREDTNIENQDMYLTGYNCGCIFVTGSKGVNGGYQRFYWHS
jgi:hypothetical protein